MAKRKKGDDVLPMHPHSNWVRTGGAIGDTSMHEQRVYNDSGAGVKEVIKDAPRDAFDPNDDVSLGRQKGAE